MMDCCKNCYSKYIREDWTFDSVRYVRGYAMIPCCKLCYEQYINKDGSINFKEYVKLANRKGEEWEEPEEWSPEQFQYMEKYICKCPCHASPYCKH